LILLFHRVTAKREQIFKLIGRKLGQPVFAHADEAGRGRLFNPETSSLRAANNPSTPASNGDLSRFWAFDDAFRQRPPVVSVAVLAGASPHNQT